MIWWARAAIQPFSDAKRKIFSSTTRWIRSGLKTCSSSQSLSYSSSASAKAWVFTDQFHKFEVKSLNFVGCSMDDGKCAYIRVDMKTVTTTKVGFEDIEKMRQCDIFRVDPGVRVKWRTKFLSTRNKNVDMVSWPFQEEWGFYKWYGFESTKSVQRGSKVRDENKECRPSKNRRPGIVEIELEISRLSLR